MLFYHVLDDVLVKTDLWRDMVGVFRNPDDEITFGDDFQRNLELFMLNFGQFSGRRLLQLLDGLNRLRFFLHFALPLHLLPHLDPHRRNNGLLLLVDPVQVEPGTLLLSLHWLPHLDLDQISGLSGKLPRTQLLPLPAFGHATGSSVLQQLDSCPCRNIKERSQSSPAAVEKLEPERKVGEVLFENGDIFNGHVERDLQPLPAAVVVETKGGLLQTGEHLGCEYRLEVVERVELHKIDGYFLLDGRNLNFEPHVRGLRMGWTHGLRGGGVAAPIFRPIHDYLNKGRDALLI